jgi:Tfp pilus assembly protein PilF
VTSSIADLVKRATALREAQQMEAALAVITEAQRRGPNDPRAVFGLAQMSFETWRPAADHFAAAKTLLPGNADLTRNYALALAAEGQEAAAFQLLETELKKRPNWIDGHRTLATLRLTTGDAREADSSYAEACQTDTGNPALWMAWFQHHAVARDWEKARQILASARAAAGPSRMFDLADVFLASESGTSADDDHLFDAYAAMHDPGLDICQVRHYLRAGQVERAEGVAIYHLGSTAERMFLPYLSLCWRLTGDRRIDWLDGVPSFVRCFDLDFGANELGELAAVLRGLHRLKAPYPEQSVRGGTQTDRQIFFHPDPRVQQAKAKIETAIRAYFSDLPGSKADHPLLSGWPDTLMYEGSWSVRLTDAGFHSSHTHVRSWVSSAFYVAVPSEAERGPAPSGWLALGTPPSELGLGLEPTCRVEPKAGRLVLFPATTWHSTEPFATGERLSIAFDIRLPRA